MDEVPYSVVQRIIKKNYPNQSISISHDARTAILKAGKVFILYISCIANDRCQQSGRTTITPDDILHALQEAEFHKFMGPIQDSITAAKQQRRNKLRDAKKRSAAAAAAAPATTPAEAVNTVGGDVDVDDVDVDDDDAVAVEAAVAAEDEKLEDGGNESE